MHQLPTRATCGHIEREKNVVSNNGPWTMRQEQWTVWTSRRAGANSGVHWPTENYSLVCSITPRTPNTQNHILRLSWPVKIRLKKKESKKKKQSGYETREWAGYEGNWSVWVFYVQGARTKFCNSFYFPQLGRYWALYWRKLIFFFQTMLAPGASY
jgi:hypothetical protein